LAISACDEQPFSLAISACDEQPFSLVTMISLLLPVLLSWSLTFRIVSTSTNCGAGPFSMVMVISSRSLSLRWTSMTLVGGGDLLRLGP